MQSYLPIFIHDIFSPCVGLPLRYGCSYAFPLLIPIFDMHVSTVYTMVMPSFLYFRGYVYILQHTLFPCYNRTSDYSHA